MAGKSEGGRGDGGPGWIATILGMVVLIASGFVVGLVVGVVSQEPKLVLGHVVGHDEELAWSPDSEPAITEPTDFEPALDWRPALSESGVQPGSAADSLAWEESWVETSDVSAQDQEEVSAAASAGGFVVQVGAFSDSVAAEDVARALVARGHAAYVTPSSGSESGKRRWRVRVGPAVSREDAQQLARRLKIEERLPTWVVTQEGE
jgi:cell division septation protein DedD